MVFRQLSLWVLWCGWWCAAGAGAAPAQLTVVADDNYPPYLFRNADGGVEGYLVDLWQLWQRKTGVPVKLVATDWADAQRQMAEGRADVIDTIFRTPERERTLAFTPPYADLPVGIYVHRDIGGISGPAALRGFLVGAKAGDDCVDRLREAGVSSLQGHASYAEVIDAAVGHRVRIFCMDEPPANHLLYRAGAHAQYYKAFTLRSGQFHRAVPKGDTARLALLAQGFDAISPAEQRALRDKWMGRQGDEGAPWARAAALALGMAVLALAVVLAWGMALRRAVHRRTAELQEQRARLQRLNRLYRMVHGAGDRLATAGDAEALFHMACRTVTEEGGLRHAWIGLPEAGTGQARQVAWHGPGLPAQPSQPVQPTQPTQPTQPPVLQLPLLPQQPSQPPLAAAAQPMADAALHDNHSLTFTHPGPGAALPIRVRGQAQAVLVVLAEGATSVDIEALQVLERLADLLGMALAALTADAARTQAEVALRASEARFSQIFRASPVGMTLSAPHDGRLLDVNDAWLALFQRTRSSVVGHTAEELGLWCDHAARDRVVQAVMALSPTTALTDQPDHRLRRADGHELDVAVTMTRLDMADQRYLLTSFVDVSLRRRAERTLAAQAGELERLVAQRTAELDSIFQALPDLYFRIDASGTLLDYRAGRRADLYAAPEHFMGRSLSEVMPPDVAQAMHQAMAACQHSGEPTEATYALDLSEGTTWFEARVLPHGGDFVVVVRNVSDRIALESAREAALVQAQALSRLRSEFLANMSHEIRTPLNAILGMAQIGWATSTGRAARNTFSRLLDASKLLLGIVNDVLDLSKIDADRLEVELLPVDLPALLRGVVDVVHDSAHQKGLKLQAQLDATWPPRCLGDALRLRQILINLLTNAIKFTEHGTVSLWAGCERPEGLAAPSPPPAGVKETWGGPAFPGEGGTVLVMRVSDTGPGMADDWLPQLFEPFRQADTSITRRHGGTGLGLSISRRLARLMGGDITVQSVVGQGSSFTVRLPYLPVPEGMALGGAGQAAPAAADDGMATQTWQPNGQRLRGLHILAAEDNAVNQVVLESALLLEGATVELVDNGQQAVDRVLARGGQAYALVLMDMQMPVLDGYEATRRILAIAPDLPVVGQTAEAMAEERDRCLAAGMVAHVAKPIDLELLVATVVRHARRPQQQQHP